MNRTASFALGLATLALFAHGAISSDYDRLCINGHVRARAPGITYGGKPVVHGYQRDHWCPLELGCLDTADNVHYQRCDKLGPYGRCLHGPAAAKDADEHKAGAAYCERKAALDELRQQLREDWPLDAAHGYDMED